MMKFVYGPVPSRRLGRSLGVDTIPLKTCNWNCVYCQLGRSTPLVNQRKHYYPVQDILAEVQQALSAMDKALIDWITFVGSGEPTLHAGIGWLIRAVRDLTDKPLAVITNGSLFYLPDVRQELIPADAVLPTLDAGSPEVYKTLNRPHPDIQYNRYIEGLIAFREIYTGKLWVEVMLVSGLNDTVAALRDIATLLARIQPDAVHLTLPTRPPAETWVHPPDAEGLMRATAILGDIAHVVHPAVGGIDLGGYASASEAILGIITRHPMRQEELEETLVHWAREEIVDVLDELHTGGQAQIVVRHGVQFWSGSPAYYPDDASSAATLPGRNRHTRPHRKSEG